MFIINAAALSDIGFSDTEGRINEDFVHIKNYETTAGKIILGLIADGAGSCNHQYIPSRLAAIQVEEAIERLCKTHLEEFLSCPHVFLQEAMISAGNALGAFRMADERNFNGFATSMSCVLIHNEQFAFAHTGNTRINLIRMSKKEPGKFDIKPLTIDHTKGMNEVNAGRMTFNEYHLHPSRLEVTGGLGTSMNPPIQTLPFSPLKSNDFILLTSDGIHNAIRPEIMAELIFKSGKCNEAVETLVEAAKTERYQDNMSALLFWIQPDAAKGV